MNREWYRKCKRCSNKTSNLCISRSCGAAGPTCVQQVFPESPFALKFPFLSTTALSNTQLRLTFLECEYLRTTELICQIWSLAISIPLERFSRNQSSILFHLGFPGLLKYHSDSPRHAIADAFKGNMRRKGGHLQHPPNLLHHANTSKEDMQSGTHMTTYYVVAVFYKNLLCVRLFSAVSNLQYYNGNFRIRSISSKE